jgi:hypothetical protein
MTHSSLKYCVQLTWPKKFPHKYLQKKCKLLHRGSSAFCGWKEKKWKSHSLCCWKLLSKSIPSVLSMYLSMWTVQKYFSHPSLIIYFFCHPTHGSKVGLQIGERLITAIYLDQSLWLTNQKQGRAVRSHLLHSLWQLHNFSVVDQA